MMKIRFSAVAACIFGLVFCTAGTGTASGPAGVRSSKKVGILLVAFGTSIPEARVSFERIERAVQWRFAGTPVRWAFSSRIIRERLAARGHDLESPATALARMQDEKFTHVAVQSLHTVGGEEYHQLQKIVAAFQSMDGFTKIVLGTPLLTTREDMRHTVDAVLAMIPPQRRAGDAVVLMGHGTRHTADACYAALMFRLQLRDPLVFVGTVDGYPGIDLLADLMRAKSVRKAWLLPFMSVAGNHACNDMAGGNDDSWKSILARTGIESIPVLKGTAEYDGFVKIWVDHLQDALSRL